ncbi:MAG TPA: DUF4157 domain-containing protein [Pyrinomonadaceae bacterium]|nr:DUF4157 domain-containing protein [Pyrinomonadaceae bacterium]
MSFDAAYETMQWGGTHTPAALSSPRRTPASSGVPPPAPHTIQRKSNCACGGGCPRCAAEQEAAVQPKLNISTPGDHFEQEADRVAEHVMRMPSGEHPARAAAHLSAAPGSPLQRKKCGSCASSSGGYAARASSPEEETEHVQAREVPGHAPQASANLHAQIEGLRAAGGEPLGAGARDFFEPRFGYDFGAVRVHRGAGAAESARELGALAYTIGRDIVFGEGQYAPETAAGRKLLSHELAHVVQQSNGRAPQTIQRAPAAADAKAARPAGCDRMAEDKVKQDIKENTNKGDVRPLYISLKTMRVCFPVFTEADFLSLVADNTMFYPALLKQIWADSRKPFAGYVASGYDPSDRFTPETMRERYGYTVTEGHLNEAEQNRMAPEKMHELYSEADILVFSGHQFAQYRAPGVWTDDDLRGVDIRKMNAPLKKVKLVISTSCATICKEAGETFKTLFPNATMLGFKKSAPMDGSVMAKAFARKLPKDLMFEAGMGGVEQAKGAWKSVAQEKFKEGHTQPGWLDLKSDAMEYWDDRKWVGQKWSDEANKCYVKGRIYAGFPSPRTGEEDLEAGTYQREALVVGFIGNDYTQFRRTGVWLLSGSLDFDLSRHMPMEKVKLILATRSSLLCKEAAEQLKPLFPNATVLGYRQTAPADGQKIGSDFANLFADYSSLQTSKGLSDARAMWKTHVAGRKIEQSQPGWLNLATGAMEFWDGTNWKGTNATDPANECKKKDGRPATPTP